MVNTLENIFKWITENDETVDRPIPEGKHETPMSPKDIVRIYGPALIEKRDSICADIIVARRENEKLKKERDALRAAIQEYCRSIGHPSQFELKDGYHVTKRCFCMETMGGTMSSNHDCINCSVCNSGCPVCQRCKCSINQSLGQ